MATMTKHPELTAGQQKKLQTIPRRLRKMYHRGIGGSRAAAIWLHCLECVAWSPSEVRACTAPGCVLYPYRFYGSNVLDASEPDHEEPGPTDNAVDPSLEPTNEEQLG